MHTAGARAERFSARTACRPGSRGVGEEVGRRTYEKCSERPELTMEGYAEECFLFRSVCLKRLWDIPPLLVVWNY